MATAAERSRRVDHDRGRRPISRRVAIARAAVILAIAGAATSPAAAQDAATTAFIGVNLVEGDPFEDLAVLRHPLGVMTRGGWHPAADLEARLRAAEPPDTSGLGRLRDAWTEAYEAGRVADMRTLYTEDAVRMPYDAPAVEGRASIVAAYEASFRGRGADPRIELTPLDVVERDDIVVERGAYDERWLGPDGAVRYEEVGKYVSVAQRGSDGAWRYAVSIFNRDAPP